MAVVAPSPEEARACVAAAAGAGEGKIESAKITVNLTSVATHVDGELDQRETLFTVRARTPPRRVGDNEGLLVLWDLGVAVELRPNHDIAAVDLAGIHHGVPAPRLATGLRSHFISHFISLTSHFTSHLISHLISIINFLIENLTFSFSY